jgi:hypothetical protein
VVVDGCRARGAQDLSHAAFVLENKRSARAVVVADRARARREVPRGRRRCAAGWRLATASVVVCRAVLRQDAARRQSVPGGGGKSGFSCPGQGRRPAAGGGGGASLTAA